MLANLENSAVTTGLEKVSFHSNPKERHCQRMFKLPHSCTYFTCQQGNAPNLSSQASAVCEPRTSRCAGWIQKRQRNQRSNWQHSLDHGPQCSLQHYLLQPRHGTNLNVHNRGVTIEDAAHVYNGTLLSHKNNICSNMDGPRDCHTKQSKLNRERQILHDITYMWNVKKWYK